MARSKKSRNVTPYSMKGFPTHATTSHLQDNHTWLDWGKSKLQKGKENLIEYGKQKLNTGKNIVEKGAEIFSWAPGFVGKGASAIDAMIDTYDANKAFKEGNMELYNKEKADAMSNVLNIVTPGGKIVKKVIEKGAKKIIPKVVSKTAPKAIEKTAGYISKKGTQKSREKLVDDKVADEIAKPT